MPPNLDITAVPSRKISLDFPISKTLASPLGVLAPSILLVLSSIVALDVSSTLEEC